MDTSEASPRKHVQETLVSSKFLTCAQTNCFHPVSVPIGRVGQPCVHLALMPLIIYFGCSLLKLFLYTCSYANPSTSL